MKTYLKNWVYGLALSGLFSLLPQMAAGQDLSIRNNLLYDASGTVNAGLEFQVGDHFSVGVNGGYKSWPRFLAWDNDNVDNPTHWRHLLVAPEARYYFDEAFKGTFLGADLLYTHYNVGNVKFPFGLYPEIRDYRLQGDYYAAGLFAGYAWRLGPHWRIEVLAGLHVGYADADKFECPHCGAKVGAKQGVSLLPNLGVNMAYNFKRRERQKKEILEIIAPLEPQKEPEARQESPEASTPDKEKTK